MLPGTSVSAPSAVLRPPPNFYLQLQQVSGDIAKLTHYHRSRITGQDRSEVTHKVSRIKARLKTLWESRSAPQRQTPGDIHSHLAAAIADPLIALVGVCEAAYHTKLIEINRLLGDPGTEHDDCGESMRSIREIVDSEECNPIHHKWNLRSGYLRSFFLSAFESMDHAESGWAVERLHSINDPICRSKVFATFAEALCATQLRKERRVSSKYFGFWYFGMPPAFLRRNATSDGDGNGNGDGGLFHRLSLYTCTHVCTYPWCFPFLPSTWAFNQGLKSMF